MPDLELKPCPFCGDKHPELIESYAGYGVSCSNCDIATDSDDWTKEKAIEIWNTRTSE